jgi:hypothetical protein
MNGDEDAPAFFSLPPGDRSLAGAVMEGRDFMLAQLALDLTSYLLPGLGSPSRQASRSLTSRSASARQG